MACPRWQVPQLTFWSATVGSLPMYFEFNSLVMVIIMRAVAFSGLASEAKSILRIAGVAVATFNAELLSILLHDREQVGGRYVLGQNLQVYRLGDRRKASGRRWWGLCKGGQRS